MSVEKATEATSLEAHAARARELSAKFARTYSEHDMRRDFPHEEMRELKQSGLLKVPVPTSYGGAGASFAELIDFVLILARGNPSIGHMFAEHAVITKDVISNWPDEAARRVMLDEIVNRNFYVTAAGSERNSRNILAYETALTATEKGDAVLINGTKFFCTGAIASEMLFVPGVMDGEGAAAVVHTNSEGISVRDDWDAMGMQATWSGSVVFKNARAPITWTLRGGTANVEPTPYSLFGPMFQTVFSALPLATAQASLTTALDYVKTKTRPWVTAGVDKASEDPYILRDAGRNHSYLTAAELLIREAARAIDRVIELRDSVSAEEGVRLRLWAMSMVAQARVVASEAALNAATDALKMCGGRSALRSENLDRFFRDIRTITLHDPVEYKAKIVGEYMMRGNYAFVPFLS